MIGMIYERCHTRELAAYGGLAKLLPVYSVAFMILTLASIGLPTTSGFTGEFLVLLGAFNAAWAQHVQGSSFALVPAVLATTGVVLGALYMLRFAALFLFGPARLPASHEGHGAVSGDLVLREKLILGALIAAIFWLGLFPGEPMRKTETAAREYQQLVQTSRVPTTATAQAGQPGSKP
jgi:NADH-quinone oxidoreductase subunit M